MAAPLFSAGLFYPVIEPENMQHTGMSRVFKEKTDNETNICNTDISLLEFDKSQM
jgi:hypothetical protein